MTTCRRPDLVPDAPTAQAEPDRTPRLPADPARFSDEAL
jgi:hypothetical protein